MSGFVGADVDQLAALAATFDRRSAAFNQIASASSSALMVAEWTGADVDRVRSEWNRQARPAIQRVAVELAALAVELRKQAEQQREASGGAGGGGGAIAPPGRIDIGELFWQTVDKVKNTELGESTLSIGEIAAFVPGVGLTFDILSMADSFAHGEAPVHTGVDVAAGALRSSKHPIAYGVGVAVGVWNNTIEEFEKADLSDATRANTANFMNEHPGEAVDAAVHALVDWVPKLAKNFTFW